MKISLILVLAILSLSAECFAGVSIHKMYRSMYPKVSSNCDIHTEMTMTEVTGVIKEITLTDKVSGACEIFVAPNSRTYQLEVNTKASDGGCGSVYYIKKVNDDLTVKLQDHRKRRCENPVPNLLVVSEKDYEEMGKTLYSLEQ
ncbi:MAG: hypothetical protein K2Q18_16635 [Bdellovibrionales bacterium]|nr:hypothetical protein [Bdellovibrionales bacterium]